MPELKTTPRRPMLEAFKEAQHLQNYTFDQRKSSHAPVLQTDYVDIRLDKTPSAIMGNGSTGSLKKLDLTPVKSRLLQNKSAMLNGSNSKRKESLANYISRLERSIAENKGNSPYNDGLNKSQLLPGRSTLKNEP